MQWGLCGFGGLQRGWEHGEPDLSSGIGPGASQRHRLADVLLRRCPLLRHWLRGRCVVCQAPETPEAYVCPTPDCAAVYCRPCWDDMRRRCPACTPREELSSSAYSDSNDDATYAE